MAGGVDADHDFVIDSDTLWGELFGTLTDSEQSCISRELGSELLASVRERPVMSGGETYQWEVQIFGCVTPETAATLVFASLAEDFGELSEGDETCLQDLLVGIDLAGMLAGSLPDASPESAAAAELFSLVLLGCVAGQLLPGTTGPIPSPEDESLLWRFDTGGWVVVSPTVVDGVVYAGSDDNHVYAINATSGEMLWRFETGDVVRSSPTVTGGVVYFGSNDTRVYALDAETGEFLWKYCVDDWAQFSPTVSDGVVYLGALADGDHKIHALDALSGELLWVAKQPYSFDPEFTPAVVGDKVYAPGASGEFHVLDTATGELAWSFSVSLGATSPPTVIDVVVYLTAVNTAYALDELSGALIWDYGTERYPARDFPALIADGVYYFSPDEYMYALDTATGEPIWSYQAADLINIAPITSGGVVYVGSEAGVFYALDAATGELLWSRETAIGGWAAPTVVDGVLYAESSDGYLLALDAVTGEDIWQFQKGYFAGIPSATIVDGVLYLGSLDGGVYAFTAPARR